MKSCFFIHKALEIHSLLYKSVTLKVGVKKTNKLNKLNTDKILRLTPAGRTDYQLQDNCSLHFSQ